MFTMNDLQRALSLSGGKINLQGAKVQKPAVIRKEHRFGAEGTVTLWELTDNGWNMSSVVTEPRKYR